MRILLLFLFVLVFSTGSVRGQQAQIKQILEQVSLDSLLFNAESLTGIKPVDINGTPRNIVSRHKDELGNVWAGMYLRSRMEGYGYTVNEQIFSSKGQNFYAIKTGTKFPDRAYMICAHYDAIAVPFSEAVGADDNASGTSAVLEAARVLKDTDFPYSIIFAFWDEEEQGLIGSTAFTQQFDFDQIKLEAVINLDMIANDRNDDMRAEIHTQPVAYSEEMVLRMLPLNDSFTIGLDLEVRNPGTSASDHAAFWDSDISAILLIEDKQDFNPYYHTKYDSVKYFNDSFFFRNSQFAIASLCWFALQENFKLDVGQAISKSVKLYPNPSSGIIRLESDRSYTYRIVNSQGTIVQIGEIGSGSERLELDKLSAGMYRMILQDSQGKLQGKSFILR